MWGDVGGVNVNHIYATACRGQRVFSPLELELEVVLSCHVGAENWLRFSTRAIRTLNCFSISLAP